MALQPPYRLVRLPGLADRHRAKPSLTKARSIRNPQTHVPFHIGARACQVGFASLGASETVTATEKYSPPQEESAHHRITGWPDGELAM